MGAAPSCGRPGSMRFPKFPKRRKLPLRQAWVFLRLPLSRQGLFWRTLPLVWIIRLGLWVLPFAVMKRFAARIARRPNLPSVESPTLEQLRELVWAVERASERVPQATCLTQALAIQILLARRGYHSQIHIGVAKNKEGLFQAHAWVECEGRILVGGRNGLSNWAPLTALDLHA